MKIAISLLALFLTATAVAEEKKSPFDAEVYSGHKGEKMPYRLLKPENYDKSSKYPVVLFLHGWGQRGTDNNAQLKAFGSAFTKSEIRKKYPCFVIAPQANGSWVQHPTFDKPILLTKNPTANLTMAVEILTKVEKRYSTDPNRIYLMGYSNGACGVWELLERIPQKFAAAVPMAGAGDPSHVAGAKSVAIWAFHGEKDETIPIARMMELMSVLKAAHAAPLYTVIPKGGHGDAKGKGLSDPEVIPWMFAQQRGKPLVPFDQVAGPAAKRPTSLAK
jgi:predicted peptidase